MSLVNVWISPTRAMVCVDTEAQTETGEYIECSKMLSLPHANVVIAGRGQNAFMNVLFSLLHMSPAASFDALDDAMPAALATATAYLAGMKDMQFSRSIYEQEIGLVGYSREVGAMYCRVYQSKDESGFVDHDIDQAYLSPWDGAWGQPAFQATTPEHARIISTEQVANALAMHPVQPFGGRLLLAELTKDGCRISTLARVTERAQSL